MSKPGNEYLNPYLFLVGCPRSGTTLLQRMIDAHPEITITHEQHWIPRYYKERRGLTPDGLVTHELIPDLLANKRCPIAQLGISVNELEGLIARREPVSYATFVTRIFDEIARQAGKRLAGDKTPGYVRELPTLHALWPSARFIHLIRDGRDVCLSMLNWLPAEKRVSRLRTAEDPVGTLAAWWERRVRRGREDGSALGSQLYCEVRYEDLVAHPQEECARLCSFLELPYHDAMLRFHEGRTIENPGLDAKDAWRPVTRGLRDWRSQLPAVAVERFERVAGALLEELGYPRSGDRFQAMSEPASDPSTRCSQANPT